MEVWLLVATAVVLVLQLVGRVVGARLVRRGGANAYEECAVVVRVHAAATAASTAARGRSPWG
jgi:hypothetical protein